jgi:hypothetical protein
MNVNLSLAEPIISGETRDPSIKTEKTMTSIPKRAAEEMIKVDRRCASGKGRRGE